MVPVRSEPSQPELPSVSPIRLKPREPKVPNTSGPLPVAEFTATMVLRIWTVPFALNIPPPRAALLALIVQLVSEVAPSGPVYRPPPLAVAVLPLMVQLVSVLVLFEPLDRPPPFAAELPLTVES